MLGGRAFTRDRIGGAPTDIRNSTRPFNMIDRRGGNGRAGPMGRADFGNTALQRSTIGIPSNHFIPYLRFSRAYLHAWMNMEQLHMVMIVKKDKDLAGEIMSYKRRADYHIRYAMSNIPMWNYMQACRQKKPTKPEEVIDPTEAWKDYFVDGVVRNETGEDTDNFGNPAGGKFENQERGLNDTIRGTCRTFNVWGRDVQPGTHLWLILKGVKIDPKNPYRLNVADKAARFPRDCGLLTAQCVLQLVPYASTQHFSPPMSERMYYDEFGQRWYGLAIYCGTAEDVPERSPFSNTRFTAVANDVNAIISQGIVDVMIDPHVPRVVYD